MEKGYFGFCPTYIQQIIKKLKVWKAYATCKKKAFAKKKIFASGYLL
jgi:hypothetical protein